METVAVEQRRFNNARKNVGGDYHWTRTILLENCVSLGRSARVLPHTWLAMFLQREREREGRGCTCAHVQITTTSYCPPVSYTGAYMHKGEVDRPQQRVYNRRELLDTLPYSTFYQPLRFARDCAAFVERKKKKNQRNKNAALPLLQACDLDARSSRTDTAAINENEKGSARRKIYKRSLSGFSRDLHTDARASIYGSALLRGYIESEEYRSVRALITYCTRAEIHEISQQQQQQQQAETLLTRAAACTRGFVKETGDGGSTSSHPMCAYSPIGVQALVVRKREALGATCIDFSCLSRGRRSYAISSRTIYMYVVVRVTPVDSWHGEEGGGGGGGGGCRTSAQQVLSTQSRSRCSHEDETWLPILSVRLAASSFLLRRLGLPTMIVHLRVSYPGGWMGSCLSGHALNNSKITQMTHVRHRTHVRKFTEFNVSLQSKSKMMMQQQKQRTPLNRLLAPVESCNESGLVDVRTSTRSSSSKSPIVRNQRTLETRTRTTLSTSRAAAAAAATTATTKTAVSAATTCLARPTSSRHVQRSTTSVAPNSSVSSSSSWNSSCGSSSTSTSSSIRRLSVAAWALALLLVLASSCFGGAEAGSIMGDSFSKRSFMDIQCKGFYDRSHFARLDRICEDCYNLFREPQLHSLCRNNCFTSEYFKGCMDVLLLQDEEAKIQQAIKILHGADPGV
ncbi:unnamed protein product [Trichogramma brassicae]|uniref:Ion transport peptide-like protein n=1 Tax=Trichogramma brassicae TaxID=86971 RepID=A0A6H5INP1_9HYME|nr:unnamed protein product [Trichogramma brassicae]